MEQAYGASLPFNRDYASNLDSDDAACWSFPSIALFGEEN